MVQPARLLGEAGDAVSATASRVTRSVSDTEQARREAWGKQAGAQVAAAYKQLEEQK